MPEQADQSWPPQQPPAPVPPAGRPAEHPADRPGEHPDPTLLDFSGDTTVPVHPASDATTEPVEPLWDPFTGTGHPPPQTAQVSPPPQVSPQSQVSPQPQTFPPVPAAPQTWAAPAGTAGPPAQPPGGYLPAPVAWPAVAPGGVGETPFAPYGVDPGTGRPLSNRSRVAAGLLGIFLGGFGVGRFYTGHIGIGVGQLIATCGGGVIFGCLGVLFFPLWLLAFAGPIWGLIDGIMVLASRSATDAQGRLLRP